MTARKQIEVHTDGACLGNPGPGGWAALLRWREVERELSGGEADTTNNRMELMAAISALETLKEPCSADLYTDSSYVRDGTPLKEYEREWRQQVGKPLQTAVNTKRLATLFFGTSRRTEWAMGVVGARRMGKMIRLRPVFP